MIKAKINSTGEVVEVRPCQTEKYDFMVCRNDGIMGELYMRSELTIIGDNELDFISLVKRMREAQNDNILYDIRMRQKAELGIRITDEDNSKWRKIAEDAIALAYKVDKYLDDKSKLSLLAKPCPNFDPKDDKV